MNKKDLSLQLISIYENTIHIMKKISPELLKPMEDGLTHDQFYILDYLDKKGVSTAGDLATEFHVKPSAMTTMVSRLYKSKFISKHKDETDKRITYISLTKKGRLSLENARDYKMMVSLEYFSKVNNEDLQQLQKVLERINESI